MDNSRMISKFGLSMSAPTWHNVRTEFMATCLYSVFNVVFNQFYVPMAIRHGASHLEVGLLAAAPAIGLMFSPMWAGWIERTGKPKPFVIWPNVIGRLLILLPAFFGAPSVFVATALLFHLLMGIQAPGYASLMTQVYPAPLRGRIMGYIRVAMGILMIPLAYGIGFWIDARGSSGALIAASVFGVASISIFSRLRRSEPDVPSHGPSRRPSLKEQWALVKTTPSLGLFFAATTLSGFGNILASPLYQIVQVQRLELTNVEIGYARIIYFAFLLLSYLAVGWAIDRFSPQKTLIYGIGGIAVTPLLYGLFGNYASVLIGSGVQGIVDAIWDIGILSFVFRLAPGREAVVFGLHLMLFGIRGSIAPLLSTGLSGVMPIEALLLIASAFGWLGTALFYWGSRRTPAGEPSL